MLYLHLVERLTHDEGAELLDITAEASRARLSRGLRRLRVQHDDLEVHPLTISNDSSIAWKSWPTLPVGGQPRTS